jgi:peptidoglycan glycosyltransferase
VTVREASLEHHIARLGRALLLCFVAVALALGYWGIIRSPALVAREDNPRRVEAERRIQRGNIYDRRGRTLVESRSGAGGVWKRVYLVPDAAPVVGYASIDLGTSGIESAYDAELRGDAPTFALEQVRRDLLHLYPAGADLQLTLDMDLQQLASATLGERTGAVVLLDVQSGAVLAMASEPVFDPNTLEEDWPRLQFDRDKPMLNRATQGLYPPGLIFETLTLVAVMEGGLAEPGTVFTDELGVVLEVEPPIACPTDPPATTFTLAEAYTWPCSVLFARLGLELGGEQLADFVTRIGIGRPLDFPLDASTGQVLERGQWSRLLAARTAMGAGEVLVTPLEMALAIAAIANDGLQAAPHLVLAIDGEPLAAAQAARRVVSAETARQVRTVLEQAFSAGRRGTSLPDADLAGRAGSADSGLPGAPPHAWFIGYGPATQPRYAVAVIVEHGDSGWEVAAPIAVQVLEAAVQ